ncbi:hypothetical protein Golomagni_02559 [Golovinomyces magnicellulatus]|nr:hypothetical protein Golomagni_02559 [Golovinomyces magnicellulatus]
MCNHNDIVPTTSTKEGDLQILRRRRKVFNRMPPRWPTVLLVMTYSNLLYVACSLSLGKNRRQRPGGIFLSSIRINN